MCLLSCWDLEEKWQLSPPLVLPQAHVAHGWGSSTITLTSTSSPSSAPPRRADSHGTLRYFPGRLEKPNFRALPLPLTRGFFHFLFFSCLELLCRSKDLGDFILPNTFCFFPDWSPQNPFCDVTLGYWESVLKWVEGFSFRDWTAGDD